MRIRKHAKISPLVYATSSLKLGTHIQTHICQLNQSPWDVMKFSPPSTPPPPPPPPTQVDGDGDCAVNDSLRGCISVIESDHWEAKSTTVKEEEAAAAPKITEEKIILCCKTDGKSWQCKKEAAKGSALCHHHLMQARSYNNGCHYMGKKTEKLSGEARRPARDKKASTTSNPYEFYYYSGFGPRWGKKRGDACNDIKTTDTTNCNNNVGLSENVDHEVEMGDDESDFDDYEVEEEINSRDNNIGKKRVRKPIKARSLKSLM